MDFGTFLGFGIWDLGFRLLPCALCCTSFLIALSLTAAPQTSLLSALPLCFEAGAGAESPPDRFVAMGWGGAFDLRAGSATVTLVKAVSSAPCTHDLAAERIRHRTVRSRTVHWQWVGANAQARISGVGELPGKVNYLLGNDPTRWRAGVPIFGKVRIEGLYPGVDLVCYGNQRQLEYDFVLAPGANADGIGFRVSGADELKIDAQGDLILQLGDDQLRQLKPRVYQTIGGAKKEIAGGYRLKDRETVAFQIGSYDPELPLVIDPVLSYSTFLGGTGQDIARGIALDGNANIYITGDTLSANLPFTPNAEQTNYAGGFPGAGGDAFVAKFDNSGSNLFYLTYLGGSGDDAAVGIAVDTTGNAYLTGVTDSTNFPTKLAIKNHISGTPEIYVGLYPYDAFVAKLNTNGSALVYSTYLGGDTQDQGLAIALDTNGNAYVTGFTDSPNFPVTTNALQPQLGGLSDAFVTKIAASGTNFVYSTYLGGTNNDHGEGIAVAADGTAFVSGFTGSTNFPVLTNAFQRFLAGVRDAFVGSLGPFGTNFAGTYFGGQGDDFAARSALDSTGNNLYVTGSQSAFGFPITPGNLNPGGVFRSTDGGSTWSPATAGLQHNVINSLALDPLTPAKLYTGTWRGLAGTANGATNWTRILELDVARVLSVLIDPTNTSVLYAGTFGIVSLPGQAGFGNLLKSTNGGLTWSMNSTGIVSLIISKLVLDPHSPATLYAGTEAGIFKSTDAAATWSGASSGLGNPFVSDLALVASSPPTLYAATAGGVYRSSDAGTNWSAFNNGLTNLVVQALAIHPLTPAVLYAGTAQGLFQSSNSGTNWSDISSGLGNSNITALAVDPLAPATVYAGTACGLFKSTTGGGSWSQATNGLGLLAINAFVIDTNPPATIYAGTRGTDAFGGEDAFLAKFDRSFTNGSFLVFGGNNDDQGVDVAVDLAGNAYVTGATASTNFPTTNTSGFLSATNNGFNDVFVTAIKADTSAFLYSAYLGGAGDDFGLAIESDPPGNVYLVGETSSANFPTNKAFQATFGGVDDAFLVKILADGFRPSLMEARAGTNLQLSWPAYASEFGLESNTNLAAPTNWILVSPVPPAANGRITVTVAPTNTRSFFRLKR